MSAAMLFPDDPLEMPAEHIRPNDRIRRGIRVYRVDRVDVSHDAPIVITANRLHGDRLSAEAETLSFPPQEIIRRLP